LELKKGSLVGNEYRIEAVLADNDASLLYSAWGLRDPRPFVLRVLPPEASGPQFVSRFARAQQIDSPHLPKLFGIGTLPDGRTYVAMEQLDGESLKKAVARTPLSITDAVDYTLQACHAIGAAHVGGIVHRRLRTSSLFLARSPDGTASVRVLDLGTSVRNVSPDRARAEDPEYLAPEQVSGATGGERRSDIWALGVVLYELVTGKLPFTGFSRKAIAKRIVDEEPQPPRSIRTDLPWQIEQAILRCLDKSASSRSDTVVDLAAAIRPFSSERARLAATQLASFPAPTASRPTSHPSGVNGSLPTAAGSGGRISVAARASGAPSSGRPSGGAPVALESDAVLPGPRTARIPTESPALPSRTPALASSADEEGHDRYEAGFHRMTADGQIERMTAQNVARTSRALRVADQATILAREARNSASNVVHVPPQPEKEDEIRPLGRPPKPVVIPTRNLTQRIVLLILAVAVALGVGVGVLVRLLQPSSATPATAPAEER
jgi:serine/threonine protein kinase